MAIVDIAIKDRIASVHAGVELVCNNPTDTIRFIFDEEWNTHTERVARFVWENDFVDVPFTGDEVKAPEITNTIYVFVGVYADDIASTYAKVQCKRSILCLGGKERLPGGHTNYYNFEELVKNYETYKSRIESAMINMGGIADDADFNNLITAGIYYAKFPNTHSNSPNGRAGILMVTEQSSVITQDFVCIMNGERYVRYSINGSWEEWKSIFSEGVVRHMDSIATDADFNDCTDAGIYYASVPSNRTNAPEPKAGILIVTKHGSAVTQNWFGVQTGMHYGRFAVNGSWREWVTPAYLSDYHDKTAVYYAFGDSTTYGQIAVTGARSPNNYPACVGRVLGMNVVNKAVGGQGLIKDWDTIFTNYIDGLDMSDAKLITVGWAYNDGESRYKTMNFGTPYDTTPDTFIGKYYTIMKAFQEKCPNALVVLVTGYGMSGTTYDQFKSLYAFADGNQRIKVMYDTLEEMCNLNGWSCINQARGTWITRYNWSTYIGDNIHPTAEGYVRYGSFIAAKMAAIYGNLSAT